MSIDKVKSRLAFIRTQSYGKWFLHEALPTMLDTQDTKNILLLRYTLQHHCSIELIATTLGNLDAETYAAFQFVWLKCYPEDIGV